MKIPWPSFCAVFVVLTIRFMAAAESYNLAPLWSAAPGSATYVTSSGGANTPNERSMAYDPVSNRVFVVQRSANNYTVHVIHGDTGAKLHNLKTNGIVAVVASEVAGANGIGLVAIDVADDGAVYASNESPNASGGSNPFSEAKLFRVYRWADSSPDTIPDQIFQGDPANETGNFRWGDVLAVRGSGTATQIALDNQNTSAKFLAILQPVDASLKMFTNIFFIQDIASPFGGGIGRTLEFGTGNTVWQKRRGAALLQHEFDPATPGGSATLLAEHANYPTSVGPVAIDLVRKIAVGINFVTVTTAPDTLDLYDISEPDNPILIAAYNFPINHVANNNSIGRVIISGDRVYALNGNNGLLAFRISTGPLNPPSISAQPQNIRLVAGTSGTLRVITADTATFQWQRNGTDLPGATDSAFTLVNAQAGDAGEYRVIVSNSAGSTTSSNAIVTVEPPEKFYRLAPLWSLAPESRPYLPLDTDGQGRTPYYRSIAYNALSNQVYIISRTSAAAGLSVNVLDASTGEDIHPLDTSTIFGGSIVLLSMGAAEDGALYASNMDTSGAAAPAVYNLYRWADSSPTTVPELVFSGEPAGLEIAARWGDTMAVRGSGANTEILIDANSGAEAVVFKPADGTFSTFTPNPFSQSYGSGSIGRSLQFGNGNTFWQKRSGSALQFSSYDLVARSSAPVTNYSKFPASLGPVAIDVQRKLLAGINFASSPDVPGTLDLYEVSDFNNPLLIARYDFPVEQRPNNNLVGQVLFAGDRVYAIQGNNGAMALRIVAPAVSADPSLMVSRSGNNVTLAWPATASAYRLQSTPSLNAPIQWTEVTGAELIGNEYRISVSSLSGSAFYRLSKTAP